MKVIFGSFILLSGLFSAQTSLGEPTKTDSTNASNSRKPLFLPSLQENPIDSTLVQLYKMPVAKPKNPEIYSSLNRLVKRNTQFKILNSLDSIKSKKLATK